MVLILPAETMRDRPWQHSDTVERTLPYNRTSATDRRIGRI